MSGDAESSGGVWGRVWCQIQPILFAIDRSGDDLRVNSVRELNGGSEIRNTRKAEAVRWFLTMVKRL